MILLTRDIRANKEDLPGKERALHYGIGFIVNFLDTLGIGHYAPVMCVVYLLGMNPTAAFTIMMCMGTLCCISASFTFLKNGRFHHYAAWGFNIGGVFGVLAAVLIVKSLSLSILQWLVIVVVVYTGITMLRDAFEKKKEESSC